VSWLFFLEADLETNGNQWQRIFNSGGVEVRTKKVVLHPDLVGIQRVSFIKTGLHFSQSFNTEGKQVLHSSKIIFQ
jgi:hypothetical protein